jgi:DNA-3-methyladenine glycosylase I
MTSYCEYVRAHPEDTLNKTYHDREYGFPLADDAALFERLVLEINQAGLSWTLILRRAPEFRRAYGGFNVDTVAAYGETDTARLLADAGVIRNRLKVRAAVENARRIQNLRSGFGSFKGWLDAHHPLSLEEWTKLFNRWNIHSMNIGSKDRCHTTSSLHHEKNKASSSRRHRSV